MKRTIVSLMLVAVLLIGMVPAMATYVEPTSEFVTEPMIAVGSSYTIALRSDGTVWAWGSNWFGQLGDGTTTDRHTPVQVPNLNNATAIAAGSSSAHTLALFDDGTVQAWGNNEFGQLGDGTTTNRHAPVKVPNLNDIIDIATGSHRTIALHNDGTVWAWGRRSGQLGDGTTISSFVPVQVQNLKNITAIAAGFEHTVALHNDGTVWAWGWNCCGQLGDGTTVKRPVPVQVPNLNDITAIAADAYHTIALRNDGTVWAWGANCFGQLGDGTGGWGISRYTPVQVQNLNNVTAIATGYHHTVALRSDGTVWAWGTNWFGQLGDGTTTARYTPTQVKNLSNVTAISAGDNHTVALRNDGTVWAWGGNQVGQLGDGTTSHWDDDNNIMVNARLAPVQVHAPGGFGYLSLLGVFPDVAANQWYYAYVQFVHEHNIMHGNPNRTFAPAATLTRAQVTATLFRLYHERIANADDPRDTQFTDVPSGNWYAPYIAWAYTSDITDGVGGGRFAPSAPVTREQFATMLHRFAGAMGLDDGVQAGAYWDAFTDRGLISDWAEDALMWANYHGLITGVTQTTIVPGGNAVRAQAAAILTRFADGFDWFD